MSRILFVVCLTFWLCQACNKKSVNTAAPLASPYVYVTTAYSPFGKQIYSDTTRSEVVDRKFYGDTLVIKWSNGDELKKINGDIIYASTASGAILSSLRDTTTFTKSIITQDLNTEDQDTMMYRLTVSSLGLKDHSIYGKGYVFSVPETISNDGSSAYEAQKFFVSPEIGLLEHTFFVVGNTVSNSTELVNHAQLQPLTH